MFENNESFSTTKITMLLASYAEAISGRLYVCGGGWDRSTAPLPPHGIAIKVDVPWVSTSTENYTWKLELLDQDGKNVQSENKPIVLNGSLTIQHSEGNTPGTESQCVLALNLPSLNLSSGRYEWRFSINNATQYASFTILEKEPQK